MPIDPRIALGVQPLQLPQQDPNAGMNSLARIMQIKSAMQEGDMNALKMDEYKRGLSEQEGLRTDLAAPGADPYNVLLRRGKVKEAGDFRKSENEAKNADASRMKTELETGMKKAEHVSSVLSLAKDPQSYAVVRAVIKNQFGQDLPEQFDPRMIEAEVAKGQTYTQRLQAEHQRLTLAETTRHNTTTETETGRHNRGTEGIQIRGQNLTDSRARDFNAIQQDANNIKRTEKKQTEDLTKNSQIASFDTMLGTLDRLAAHPGLKRSVGKIGAFPTMPGSDSANFQAELNTFQSQAFLPMVAQLKGMGALSDAEGKKLTAAVGALDPKMGEQAFRDSVARITADMEAARERMAGQKRNPEKPAATPGAQAGPKPGTVQDGYRFKGGNPADPKSWEKI